eukprot:403350576
MVNKNLTTVKKNSLVSVSNSYVEPENISLKGINFAFKLSDYLSTKTYEDQNYGSFQVIQHIIKVKQNTTDPNDLRNFQEIIVPFSKCQIGKNIDYPNKEEINLYKIEEFYCLDFKNLSIQGNWYSPEFRVVDLQFKRCQGLNCSTDEELQDWLKNKWVQQVFISSYFDISDYENPIKYFFDDSYHPLEFGRTQYNSVYYKKDLIQLSDSIVGYFSQQKTDYFYQVSKQVFKMSLADRSPDISILFMQDIKLDKEYDIYERQVYSLDLWLQDVGGFYNSLFFIGLILFSQFQGTFIQAKLISRLYRIKIVKISVLIKQYLLMEKKTKLKV